MTIFTRILLLGSLALFGSSNIESSQSDMDHNGFPSFEFENHDEQARLLSLHLKQHFAPVPYISRVMFYQDYMSLAHLWMGQAHEPATGLTVQDAYRRNLLSHEIDAEGYVKSHQHFSYAHDHGWPFPIWIQSGKNAAEVAGVTAGWLFQNNAESPDPSAHFDFVQKTILEWDTPQYYGEGAIAQWKMERCESLGIQAKKWRIHATGVSPCISTQGGFSIDAFNAPFIQLRWMRTGSPASGQLPYIEWRRQGDSTFSAERRVYMHTRTEEHQKSSQTSHTLLTMYRHPLWQGKIEALRFNLAPGESDVTFDIDSIFTCYDTRHPINNPRFIMASWNYFRWTGDIDFLSRVLNNMRQALRYQMTEMGGLQFNHIRNTWPGHDGRHGFINHPDGQLEIKSGHGIGNNYFDLLPFGGDDMYSTSEYYGALRAMAKLERLVRMNPGWGLPLGAQAFDPVELDSHADMVKETANRLFWDEDKKRFVGCINADGQPIDYGFVFVNQEAIWQGIATNEHARQSMDWITGRRVVKGDTSTGADIYRWRFGPRTTTIRNIDWYTFAWYHPEIIPWGNQVQDGGSVLGFTFYDLWARLQVYGTDDAWQRLMEILEWKKEVETAGGYRAFYSDPKQGNNLQGGWAHGGLGVDSEFLESLLPPSIVIYGFLGLDPDGVALRMNPKLPKACPAIKVRNLSYRRNLMDITAATNRIIIELHSQPMDPIELVLEKSWRSAGLEGQAGVYLLDKQGSYEFVQ